MKEVNKKLNQGYTLLLKIITSLRGCKKRNNYKKGDPEEMLTELAYSLKSSKKKSIGEIILLHANNNF
ncbi:hypothetical protein K0B03_00215 [Patescibacteria group bacterium]|nr:hypothetical protein [Patescibacteria group bacterium]